jgi:hypothetical protein
MPHALGLFAAMLAGAGCVLFVNDDPSSLHTTCTFQGDDTLCARCVATACAKPLADCCGDAVCVETALPVLSTCTPGSSICGLTLAGAPELASCVTSACVASCGGGGVDVGYGGDGGDTVTESDGAVSTFDAGSTNCTPSGDSCFCEVGHPNGAVCNPSTLKGPGLCCADYGWPNATSTDCTCEPFSCTPESNGGAICNLSTDSTLTTTWSGNCCAYSTFCDCDPSGDSCGTATPVSQCDVTTIGCPSSQVQVSSCSF